MLTDRRSAILGLVIGEYIETAIPVSSRALVKRHDLAVSAATIRNELARLEEDGYITHPYTSAGRIPSDRGYRHYVEVLMSEEPVGTDEQRTIEHQLHQVRGGLDEWLSLTATILAGAVESFAVVTRPRGNDSRLKHAQLVELHGDLVLLVAVMDDGRVRQSVLSLTQPRTQQQLNVIAEQINQLLNNADGKSALDTAKTLEHTDEAMIVNAIAELIGEQRIAEETYLGGLQSVLQQPEFSEVGRLREAVDRLNAYDVRGLVDMAGNAEIGETRVLIGEEHGDAAMRDWSVVVTSYGDDEATGTIAVLGPRRMQYQRSIPRVRYVASLMSSLLQDVR